MCYAQDRNTRLPTATAFDHDESTEKPASLSLDAIGATRTSEAVANNERHTDSKQGDEVLVKPAEQENPTQIANLVKDAAVERDNRKIFVGGIAKNVNQREFRDFFSQFGTLTDSKVVFDTKTHLPRGFGFVTFEDPSVAQYVLMTYQNGKEKISIKGKTCEVKATVPRETRTNVKHVGVSKKFTRRARHVRCSTADPKLACYTRGGTPFKDSSVVKHGQMQGKQGLPSLYPCDTSVHCGGATTFPSPVCMIGSNGHSHTYHSTVIPVYLPPSEIVFPNNSPAHASDPKQYNDGVNDDSRKGTPQGQAMAATPIDGTNEVPHYEATFVDNPYTIMELKDSPPDFVPSHQANKLPSHEYQSNEYDSSVNGSIQPIYSCECMMPYMYIQNGAYNDAMLTLHSAYYASQNSCLPVK